MRCRLGPLPSELVDTQALARDDPLRRSTRALPTPRYRSRRARGTSVAGRDGELAFEIGDRVDQLGSFEGAVATPDLDLLEDPGLHETVDRLFVAWKLRPIRTAAAGTVHDGYAGQRVDQRSAAELALIRPRRSLQPA